MCTSMPTPVTISSMPFESGSRIMLKSTWKPGRSIHMNDFGSGTQPSATSIAMRKQMTDEPIDALMA